MPNLSPFFLDCLQKKICPSVLDALARSVGFLKRQSKKITPQNFLLTSCLFAFDKRPTYSSFARFWFELVGQTLSKQAVNKRFTLQAVRFMEAVLQSVLLSGLNVAMNFSGLAQLGFNRILIQDSTCLKIPKALAFLFPGSSNQTSDSAVLKVQSTLDLLKNSFISFDLTPYTVNDQKASPAILPLVQAGDLIIRDLGYSLISVFRQIDQLKAFFLSRWQPGTLLFCPTSGQQINLIALLRGRTQWDGNLLLGREKFPVRLVAERLPAHRAAERRRKENLRSKRYKRRWDLYQLLDWNLLITNIPQSQCDLKSLFKLYALRWRIEIIFKAWKSHFQLDGMDQKCSAEQVLITVLGKLIWICWFSVHFTQLVEQGFEISILKLAQWWKQFATYIFIHCSPDRLEELLVGLRYYCRYERRKDRKNFLQNLWDLNLG